jgi:hypothetical protein
MLLVIGMTKGALDYFHQHHFGSFGYCSPCCFTDCFYGLVGRFDYATDAPVSVGDMIQYSPPSFVAAGLSY